MYSCDLTILRNFSEDAETRFEILSDPKKVGEKNVC